MSRTAELLSSDISVLAHEPPVIQASGGRVRLARARGRGSRRRPSATPNESSNRSVTPATAWWLCTSTKPGYTAAPARSRTVGAVPVSAGHPARADRQHPAVPDGQCRRRSAARGPRCAPWRSVRIRSAAIAQRSSGRAGSYSAGCTVVDSSRPCAPNVKCDGPVPDSSSPNSTPCARSDFWLAVVGDRHRSARDDLLAPREHVDAGADAPDGVLVGVGEALLGPARHCQVYQCGER